MEKKIFIYTNDTEMSREIEEIVKKKLDKSDWRVYDNYDPESTDLIICIGGDGTLLRLVQEYNFPRTHIVGINTGHLGFFQEISPDNIDDFIFHYNVGKYSIQNLRGVTCSVKASGEEFWHNALNDITVKGMSTHPVHLDISINNSFIERFSGDGLCIATPAGSTAYNYSLGGGIVDPRLSLLQVTPIAPIHNVAYRSFTSSILLPDEDTLTVIPSGSYHSTLEVLYDGMMTKYDDVEEITIRLSKKTINLVRFDDYRFWEKVKSKFL